jgi:hypothetical protein
MPSPGKGSKADNTWIWELWRNYLLDACRQLFKWRRAGVGNKFPGAGKASARVEEFSQGGFPVPRGGKSGAGAPLPIPGECTPPATYPG